MAKNKSTKAPGPIDHGGPTARLGHLLPHDDPSRPHEKIKRDAVHVAIAPVIAAEDLRPGQPVGFVQPGNHELVGQSVLTIGVVDPYLDRHYVRKGERCWVMLIPGTITSLRHDWTHPEFDRGQEQIEAFAKKIDMPVDQLMEAATKWAATGEETHLNVDSPYATTQEWQEFWKNYENVTGTFVANKESGFFTCSC